VAAVVKWSAKYLTTVYLVGEQYFLVGEQRLMPASMAWRLTLPGAILPASARPAKTV